jgi:hypothetical protein
VPGPALVDDVRSTNVAVRTWGFRPKPAPLVPD